MAGGMDLGVGSKGGKKPLDAAINLVPFIDLMAVTISFLIMTAVWTQIGRLQVSSAGGPSDAAEQDQKLPPITLVVTEKELRLSVGASLLEPIPISRDARGKLETVKLLEKLKEIHTGQPDQSAITLQTEDAVRYEDLVRLIDDCIGAGLPNVSVSATS